MNPYCYRKFAPVVLAIAISSAKADTFTYDDANRLKSASQSNGLTDSYTPDAEENLLSVSHSSTDTTNSGGPGNGIPDWWEYYYYGARGIDPLANSAANGFSNLLNYVFGLNPLVANSVPPAAISFQVNSGDGKTYPYITYVCAIDAASLLTLEQSSDGVNWVSGSAYFQQVSVQDLGNGTEQIVMMCLTSLPAGAQLLFRLEAAGVSGVVSDYNIPPASSDVPAMPRWGWLCLLSALSVIAVRHFRRPVAAS